MQRAQKQQNLQQKQNSQSPQIYFTKRKESLWLRLLIRTIFFLFQKLLKREYTIEQIKLYLLINNLESLTIISITTQIMFETPLENEQIGKKQTKLFEQKKKYKNLQSDKKAYIDQSVKIIKKQKTTVDKLKKENQALKDLIAKMNKDKSQTVKTVISESQLQKMEQLRDAIREQQENQLTIDKHIANFQKKITEKRKNCMGMNSGAESESNLQKQIKILENRLDKANQKFNQTTAHNKELKNVIDSLRRQRVIFDNLYKKLEKQLHEKRKKMADIIQKANNAYEQRDKAHNQIQTLKVQSKKQAEEFQKQIKQISYLMQKIKLSEYAKKNERLNDSVTGTNFYDFEQNQTVDKKNIKQTKKNNEQIDKIHKFREDFAKIEAATQIQNFDELLRIFTENQQKNFQMFKFVNLQSNQIQELESQLFLLKNQLAKVKPSENQQEENHEAVSKEQLIEDLEIALKEMKKNLEQTKSRYQKNQLEIRPLINYIDRIFDTIQCDRELAKQMGGGNKAITENNLFVFLAIIEHKAIKIVESYKELSNPNLIGTGPIYGANKNQPINMGMLTFEDFEDNQEYNKILTAEELREKAKLFIEKEQNQKQKKKQVRQKKR